MTDGSFVGHDCVSFHTDTDGALDKPSGQQAAGSQSYQFHFQSTGKPESEDSCFLCFSLLWCNDPRSIHSVPGTLPRTWEVTKESCVVFILRKLAMYSVRQGRPGCQWLTCVGLVAVSLPVSEVDFVFTFQCYGCVEQRSAFFLRQYTIHSCGAGVSMALWCCLRRYFTQTISGFLTW